MANTRTFAALAAVMREEVPYEVQAAHKDAEKMRLEMERARMRAEDTLCFENVVALGVAAETKMDKLQDGLRSVQIGLDDGRLRAKDKQDLEECVLNASIRIDRVIDDARAEWWEAKENWRERFGN